MRRFESPTQRIDMRLVVPPPAPDDKTPRPSVFGDDEPTLVGICARCGRPVLKCICKSKEETHGDR